MVAKSVKDKGISTLANSQFNYGKDVVDSISIDMARDILNFGIEKKPCRTEEGEIIPRMYYLNRNDGGIIDANCSVGDEFEVTIQPTEIVDFVNFIMANVPNVQIETVASMYNGGTCFINLRYGGQWLVKGDTSPHFTNVLLANPCSRGKVHLVAHSVRVVCMNTLALGMKSGEGYRICHTTNARAMMEKALEGMKYELEQANKTRQMSEFLASRSINTEQVNTILDMVYPLPIIKDGESTNSLTRMQTTRNDVLNQFESDSSFTDKTFYTLLNAFTYNTEHPIHKHARTDDVQIAYENMTGNRAEFKSKVLATTLAVAMGNNTSPLLGEGDYIDVPSVMVA